MGYIESIFANMVSMKTFATRLTDGQDLMIEINKVLAEQDIEAGVILSAVGSLRKSNIRVPIIDGQVTYINPENLEIDSLHGTVSKNGCHLHISVSDTDGKVWGGHLKEGCTIRTTCELVIGILDGTTFSRSPDPDTGFDELEVTTKA